jgi:predicted dehydrogenase
LTLLFAENHMTEKLRLAIISFAHAHMNAYADVMQDFDDAEIVAAWDDNRERGESNCAKYGFEFEPDLDKLLRSDDVDAVFITSPTNQHAQHVIAAAQAGKHILLQKPMALTLADCDAIIQAVEQYGVKFSLCYQMRADPVNQKIKALLDDGAVGKVAIVRRRHAIPVLLNPSFAYPGNWHIDPVQNMGMFMDDASHAADWFYWMLGQPTSVIAEIDNIVTSIAPDDNGVAIYRFQNKEIGILLNSSTTVAAEATTEIYGDQGTIIQNHGDSPSSNVPLPPGAVSLKVFRAAKGAWEYFDFPLVKHGERIRAVPRAVIDYLYGKAGPMATAAEGRICIEMVLAAYQSARTGQRVRLPLDQEG